MVEVVRFVLPVLMVLVCGTTCFVANIKHREILRGRTGWFLGTYLIGIIITILSYRSLGEEGFIAPVIMGLILMGFLGYMSLSPLFLGGKSEK